MSVSIMRIDDRLIHGQIVTKWISYAQADTIVIADDLAANDSMQQMLLKLVSPEGIVLHICSLEAACAYIEEHDSQKMLLMVRNAQSALTLLDYGLHITKINVGNISNTKSNVGRKRMLSFLYVEPQDIACLKKIASKGITLEVRSVPQDHSIDMMELLQKCE